MTEKHGSEITARYNRIIPPFRIIKNLCTYDKKTYTVDEIQDILSLGKNTAYRLANSGQFKTVRVGSAIRISKKSFDEWLDQNLGE
ncbi:MAG: helix-turn-helix domain-containing protein [Clostridia bacterium]|nr:helix-turn-helix domain-containing protein [Clostridia bacterium]